MKQRLVALLCLITAVGAFGQGTVDFRNRNTTVTPNIDAPIFDFGGTTRLSGPTFVAQLYFSATQGGSLTAVSGTPAPFRTGAGAGYWDYGTDFSRTAAGIALGGQAWIVVRVWEAAAGSFAAAQGGGFKWGESQLPASITTGGTGNPPSVPGGLVGMQSFSLVPEPSTYALMALGACALMFRRRK